MEWQSCECHYPVIHSVRSVFSRRNATASESSECPSAMHTARYSVHLILIGGNFGYFMLMRRRTALYLYTHARSRLQRSGRSIPVSAAAFCVRASNSFLYAYVVGCVEHTYAH